MRKREGGNKEKMETGGGENSFELTGISDEEDVSSGMPSEERHLFKRDRKFSDDQFSLGMSEDEGIDIDCRLNLQADQDWLSDIGLSDDCHGSLKSTQTAAGKHEDNSDCNTRLNDIDVDKLEGDHVVQENDEDEDDDEIAFGTNINVI